MGKRLVHIDGVIFSGYLSPMINNYNDMLVIVHQLYVYGLGSVDEFFFFVYLVSNRGRNYFTTNSSHRIHSIP